MLQRRAIQSRLRRRAGDPDHSGNGWQILKAFSVCNDTESVIDYQDNPCCCEVKNCEDDQDATKRRTQHDETLRIG